MRTGRKWKAADAIQQAESRLRHKAFLGTVARERAGFGSLTPTRYNTSNEKERWRLVQEEVRASVEEERASRIVAMKKQGAWMKWEQAMDQKVTWQDIWKWNPQRIKFLIQGVYDILPNPANLFVWCKVETPACPLCSKTGTLEHILSSCSWALGDGHYRWRHNQVLKTIAEAISKGIGESRKASVTTRMIAFVKEGEQPIRKNTFVGLLFTA